MYPTLFPWIDSPAIIHSLFVGLGFVTGGLIFIRRVKAAGAWDDSFYAMLVGILLGAAVGARASALIDGVIHSGPRGLLLAWEYGGRSILGGLAGAYVGAQVGKRVAGYRGHTGNYFAPAVAVGLAIGRIGCFLTEPPGRATSLPWAIRIDPAAASGMPGCVPCRLGQGMHPSFLYEIAFLVLCAAAMRRGSVRFSEPGALFIVFLAAYSAFRFVVEFTRGNTVNSWGLTGSQVFLLVMLPPILWRVNAIVRSGSHRAALGSAR